MSNDKFRIDSHKLLYHVGRVNDWLNGKNIYPLYMEISPCGTCNHRCEFCSVDFMGYQKRKLETGRLKEIISELGQLGLKSIMYAGEGEPFLHPNIAEIAEHAQKSGIDNAFTTNGVLLKPAILDMILPVTEWIKVSCNAGTRETYAKIHSTRPEDFDRVIERMKYAAGLRRSKGYRCVLGMQSILLPYNFATLENLAAISRDIGMDYYVVKPYMPHWLNAHHYEIKYEDYQQLGDQLEKYNTANFKVVFRRNAMDKWDRQNKDYDCCRALPFWSYMDAGGNIWGCSVYLGNEHFCYGNIYEQSFESIWKGEKRRNSLEMMKSFELKYCKSGCRMDEINKYLHNLKNPPNHVNFI